MISRLKQMLSGRDEQAYAHRLTLIFLACSFFLVIGGYTLVKELKDSIFINVVGLEYLPIAKMMSLFVLVPLVFIYGRLVDVLRRYQLLYVYAACYGIGGILLAYFMGHGTIGLINTDTNAYRLFGWLSYFFLEGYNPFVVSLLWAFTNSVTSPEQIKRNYITLTASSKLGGACMAGFAWWFLRLHEVNGAYFSDVASHQFLMALASAMLLVVPFIIIALMRYVPGRHLHGYEAAYRVEKQRAKQEQDEESDSWASRFRQSISGLITLLRYPYVLGIFGMIFFWENVNVVFNFLRLGAGQAATTSAAGFGAFLYKQAFYTQALGFAFVLIGTRTIINWFGERRSLVAVPVLTGTAIAWYLLFQTADAAALAYIWIRIINYALAYPVRETLYIPTTKKMKFKSRSWIDGFGAKFSKGVGSCYSRLLSGLDPTMLFGINIAFFGGIIFAWSIMAQWLGRRFETAVENNEVIGVDE